MGKRKRDRKTPDPGKKRRRRCIVYSSEDELNDPDAGNNTTGNTTPPGTRTDTGPVASTSAGPDAAAQPGPSCSSTAPAGPGPGPVAGPTTQPTDAEPELDDAILQLLGDAPKADAQLGPKVHKDIATRWQEILTNGLTKEAKEKLLKDHLIPGNCELLVSPILNTEIKAALPDSLVRRDTLLAEKQKQLGIALAALAKATHLMVMKDDNHKIIKAMSDASRLLCDMFFNETKIRRTFAISATNSDMKETLLETKRDKYLFGENVADKLKSAKSVQRSSTDLKPNQKNFNTKFSKSNFYKNRALNMRALQRKTGGKLDAGRTRQTPAAATAAARTTRAPYARGGRSSPPPQAAYRRAPPPPAPRRR